MTPRARTLAHAERTSLRGPAPALSPTPPELTHPARSTVARPGFPAPSVALPAVSPHAPLGNGALGAATREAAERSIDPISRTQVPIASLGNGAAVARERDSKLTGSEGREVVVRYGSRQASSASVGPRAYQDAEREQNDAEDKQDTRNAGDTGGEEGTKRRKNGKTNKDDAETKRGKSDKDDTESKKQGKAGKDDVDDATKGEEDAAGDEGDGGTKEGDKDQDGDRKTADEQGGVAGGATDVGKRGANGGPDTSDDTGGDEAGGDGGRAVAEGAAGDAIDTGPPLEPAPPPRFDGTRAVIVPAPPSLSASQIQQIKTRTGLSPSEHRSRAQLRLDELSARAGVEQRAVVLRIQLDLDSVRGRLVNTSAGIPARVGQARGDIRSAFGGARGAIHEASKTALAQVEKHGGEAESTVTDAALTSQAALDAVIQRSSPTVQAVYAETMAPLKAALKKTADDLTNLGRDQGAALVKKGDELLDQLDKRAGTAVEKAQVEKKGAILHEATAQANADMTQAGKEGGAQILAQETSLGLSFLSLVNPAAVQIEEAASNDQSTVAGKQKQITLRLSNDHERARNLIDTSQRTALAQLDAGERSALAQLELLHHRLQVMADARIARLCNAMEHAEAPAAEAWADQMARVNSLVPAEGMVDFVQLAPRFDEAERGFATLADTQHRDLDRQAQSGLDEAQQGMADDLRGVDEIAEAAIAGSHETGGEAGTIRTIGKNFEDGFRAVANPTSAETARFTQRAEEKLGEPVAVVRKRMTGLLDETKAALGTQQKEFEKRLVAQINALPDYLAPAFDNSDKDVIADIGHRAEEAYAAMDRIGTQEGRLFRALSNMTPRLGAALEEYWSERRTHSLAWWLDDELSGDEYSAAVAYLAGDPKAGARYELKSTIHWYGNDKQQAEDALRALSPEDAKALGNDPGFASVRKDLEGSLKGTDLQVMQALFAGRVMRANAARLLEQIDQARMSESDDKLHDALASVDPRQLPELRREAAHLIAGGGLEQPITVTDAQATDVLKQRVTREVEIYEPDPSGEGPGTYRKATLGKDSETLAVALVTHGEGSPEARAARLSFEVARGGKPRLDRLDKAGKDLDLVRARANPALTDPKADPRVVAAARKNLAELEANRTRMMEEFARLRGASADVQKDPQKALAFTRNAVTGLMGDDPLKAELGAALVTEGRANPAIAIKLAVRGAGTDEELIRNTLRGMTGGEVQQLKLDYARRFGNGNPNALYDDLGVFQNAATARAAGVTPASGGGFFTELSGDERQEVEELLLGTPQNDRDRMRLARLKDEHQRGEGSTWVSRGMFGDSDPARALKHDRDAMERMIAEAGGEDQAFDEHGNFIDAPGRSRNEFRIATEGVREGAASYQHHIDSIADSITSAIAIIGAIVGTVVVVVLSAGTATPAVIGLWAAGIAAATGAAAMATNYALKGSRYGWEEAAVDAAITALDAATAGLTAGAGAAAGKAAKAAQAARALAKAPSERALATALLKQQTRRELARGFARSAAGAGVSGAARTATADGTWDDGILTGLGRVGGGALKSAVVGTVTHGASTAFSHSGIGQKLAESSSMLVRGAGSGLGGALGSMAGRTAEIGVDAATGHPIGPWSEALGSIVTAGGRGFVENFGQGAAEAVMAGRNARAAGRQATEQQAEELPISRRGAADHDEASHAAFRRQALLAALAQDPSLDRKAFLSRLDASVARDRVEADAQRRVVRELRREALSGIPPAQRKQFADVPIRLLSDHEFEAFTRSKSGRAVTIFIDGEPQIVARKGISPEALREEGLHVLQAKDPRMKARIARLDERTLARWDELDLDTQLSLYKDKLAVEIDAQRRLRQGLVDEAAQTSDLGKRAALLARAEEANETLANLRNRRGEVAELDPAHLDAVRRGEARRPQYLDEPARLFAKASELRPAKSRAGQRIDHTSPDIEALPRRPVHPENTTLGERYPGKRIYQVGDYWQEGTPLRWYRMTEVVDDDGKAVKRVGEILQEGGRWQQRGEESRAAGGVFEEAARLRGRRVLEQQLGRAIAPDVDPVVPIGALHTRGDGARMPLNAQHGGGAGFDDVVFKFTKIPGTTKEVAHIEIVEAKHYGGSLTLEDFSAVTRNMEKNLAVLEERIRMSSLSVERRRAVLDAILQRSISFDVQVSPTTKIGSLGAQGTSILKAVADTEVARRQLAELREGLLTRRPSNRGERDTLATDLARVDRMARELEKRYLQPKLESEALRATLSRILEGTTRRDSASEIAKRHRIPLSQHDPANGPKIRTTLLATDEAGADRLYFDEATRARKDQPQDLQRPVGIAVGLAEDIGLTDRNFIRQPLASPSRAFELLQSKDGTRTVIAVKPEPAVAGTADESPASRKLVDLVRNGAVDARGIKRTGPVVWDAAQVPPRELAGILTQIRKGVQASKDLERLRVVVPGGAAVDEAALRKLLSLPASAKVDPIVRSGEGLTWLITFPPSPVRD